MQPVFTADARRTAVWSLQAIDLPEFITDLAVNVLGQGQCTRI